MGTTEPFDLPSLLGAAGPSATSCTARHLNPQLPRMLHAIGFDRVYTRAEGAYLYDAEGNDYLDMLAGFGVFALGRHHPVVRQAMHDVLDAGLADLTQFDAPPLAGRSPRRCSRTCRISSASTSATAAPRRSRQR